MNFTHRSVPLASLALLILSFGLLIPWLGFYYDDWPTIWYLHRFGPTVFLDVFSVDRPLVGWIFMVTTALLGKSTTVWQVFGLVTRWFSCLSLWWMLRSLWPGRVKEVTWVIFLFAVYPGFQQQPISVTYSTLWMLLSTFFLSFAMMIWAVDKPRWSWLLRVASWLLAAFTMFSYEYYFFLEFLRPLILWMVLAEDTEGLRKRIQRIVFLWLPYLLISAAFLVWRVVLTVTPRGQVKLFNHLLENPLTALLNLSRTVIEDIFQSSFIAWGEVYNFFRPKSFGLAPTLLYIGIVLATILLAIFYLSRFQSPASSGENLGRASSKRWAKQAVLLGIVSLFLGGWPFWVTDLPIELRFPWDHFTLAMMLGTSLLMVGLIDLLVRKTAWKVAILGISIGLAVGFHFTVGNIYRRDWNYQKGFFWQLAWRAPGIQSGVVLLTTEFPLIYFSDNSLTAPLNWLYAPGQKSLELPYLLYNVQARLGEGLPAIEKDIPIVQEYRNASFKGSTSRAMVIYYSPPGCVKLVDPIIDATLPQKPQYLSELSRLSDLNLIILNPEESAQPPKEIFGAEPEQGWCYFFEKADLARQMGDWQLVAALGDQTFQRKDVLYEINAPELIPYIEGYAHTGQWDKAVELSNRAYEITFRMQRMVCATWARIGNDTPPEPEQQSAIDVVNKQLKCEK